MVYNSYCPSYVAFIINIGHFFKFWKFFTYVFEILVIYVVAQTEYFLFCGCGIYILCYDHVVCAGSGWGEGGKGYICFIYVGMF
jgi:hypothetical protein